MIQYHIINISFQINCSTLKLSTERKRLLPDYFLKTRNNLAVRLTYQAYTESLQWAIENKSMFQNSTAMHYSSSTKPTNLQIRCLYVQ